MRALHMDWGGECDYWGARGYMEVNTPLLR